LVSLVADELRLAEEVYRLDYLNVVSGGTTIPTATVRLQRNGDTLQAVSNGVGSVDAVYRAISEIIKVPHRLVDYNVSSVAGGTDALGEVTVRISDRTGMVHTGRGSSMDIIDASAKAYIQALNKAVLRTDLIPVKKRKRAKVIPRKAK
jgi:2-isopropylmalate synthase